MLADERRQHVHDGAVVGGRVDRDAFQRVQAAEPDVEGVRAELGDGGGVPVRQLRGQLPLMRQPVARPGLLITNAGELGGPAGLGNVEHHPGEGDEPRDRGEDPGPGGRDCGARVLSLRVEGRGLDPQRDEYHQADQSEPQQRTLLPPAPALLCHGRRCTHSAGPEP